MKHILGATVLAALSLSSLQAQTAATIPDLPAPAGSETPMPEVPVLPSPASTYDPVPATNPTPLPRQMTEEEIRRLKQDENWLVEALKKKQEEEAAAQLEKKSSELSTKKEAPLKESNHQTGEISGFKPVVADSSLATLNLNQNPNNPNIPKGKKKENLPVTSLPNSPSSANPLSTSTSGLVQPILGPSRQPMNENVASLNPGVGITPLPGTGIKKLSSNTNFVPEGYEDSWTKQTGNQPINPQANKLIPPAAPPMPRPTFKDLANTIPDPTQIR